VPESKSRKKPKPQRPPSVPKPESGNPRWLVPTMLGLMLVGLAWIVLFYLSGSAQLPIPALGAWNLGVGFAFIIAGFALTTRWK
jgi:hypothetical protein